MASQAEALSSIAGQPVMIPRATPPEQASLAALLQYEGEIRRQASVNELVYFIANETRRIVAYDQMFVLRQPRMGAGFHVAGASSLAVVDRNAPLIQAIEKAMVALAVAVDVAAPQDFAATAFSDDPAVGEYPFHVWRWQPLLGTDGAAFAGLLIARSEPMREAEGVRLARVGETAAHGWRALTGGKPVSRLPKIGKRERRWLAVAALILFCFPVRLTTLAPVEVVPAKPFVVSAPYAGVIAKIDVAPNATVVAGQAVMTFEDIKVRNELAQAEQKLQVAQARVERSTSAAFGKAEEAHDIATMRAEYDVARADYAYARDLMSKSQVTSPRGGMAIYSDRRDWEGRAVNVGEPIMQIADPRDVSFKIELPTKEQMTLEPGSGVKVWLDAQPLWAINASVETASYQARPTPEGVLAFAVTAKPEGDTPRIGSRGTAKLYGRWVPLAYSLFKRPISSARQFLGL
jgi:Barrel-sandwich domain of CusB or HlyD membrane-fusion